VGSTGEKRGAPIAIALTLEAACIGTASTRSRAAPNWLRLSTPEVPDVKVVETKVVPIEINKRTCEISGEPTAKSLIVSAFTSPIPVTADPKAPSKPGEKENSEVEPFVPSNNVARPLPDTNE
jgi:hypothetical protein